MATLVLFQISRNHFSCHSESFAALKDKLREESLRATSGFFAEFILERSEGLRMTTGIVPRNSSLHPLLAYRISDILEAGETCSSPVGAGEGMMGSGGACAALHLSARCCPVVEWPAPPPVSPKGFHLCPVTNVPTISHIPLLCHNC